MKAAHCAAFAYLKRCKSLDQAARPAKQPIISSKKSALAHNY
ncbi:hypothetical protein C4K05_5856 [Pseudomonas chlororaphis subsp. aureofaciens]|nr:hypothetical protein C4K13_5972 [Pseudomonas chlororaphis subsp. aureofaciens]AZE45151.1 hypothetical protein C4K05_5856 [Pseudomonas chlororaphis subsp. aureofaciens]